VASACVVGAESTAMRRSCTGGLERKGPTDGIHRSARTNERTSGRAGKRDPRDSKRSCTSVGEVGADKSAPLGSGRERERKARGRAGADRRGPPVRGGRRAGLGLMGWLGTKWLFLFPGIFQLLFYFIFSRVFNSNSKFQIQTNSNMCNNSKNI
jgi:hypothetical protein